MADITLWIPLVAGMIGLAVGVMLSAFLWRMWALDAERAPGKSHLGKRARLVRLLFGEVASQLVDARRLRVENVSVRQELRQLSSVLNLAPFPVWRRDASLQVGYCNLTYSTMLEDVPERILEEFGMELDAEAQDFAREALAKGAILTEDRHIVRDGERRLYKVFEIPDPDNQGAVGFALDISDRERAEDEHKRHIAAYSDLLENSNMGTAFFGSDKCLQFYNTAFMNFWKLEASWLDQHPTYGEFLEMLRERRRIPEVANFPAFKQQRLKLFTDLMEPKEEVFHLPDGRVVRVMVIPHALGGIIFSYEDVTSRVALESSYNTLIAVQRETLNNLHEGVAVFGEDGRLRLSNPVYQRLWGLDSNWAEGEPHIADVLEATKNYYLFSNWDEFKERLISQLHVRKMNYQRIERTDGTVIDWSTVPLPDGATLITYFDVTDSTLVERSLIDKNEALRAADRLKTEFLLSVSYELRSPLTSITGFAEMLKEGYFGALTPSQGEYIDAILSSSTQLAQLINNILDLASIEAGYMRLDITNWPIYRMLEDVAALVRERVRESKLELHLDADPLLGEMQGDENRIKQVLFNLLSNAIKYTPENGSITLGAKTIRDVHGDTLELWVTDTGMGIPEEQQHNVFERFRAGSIRTQRAGAGLGLAMVKNFVELHGGRVDLESEVSKGTTIRCFLPREQGDLYSKLAVTAQN